MSVIFNWFSLRFLQKNVREHIRFNLFSFNKEFQRKIKLGTRDQKHILGNREHQNRRNTFKGTREHKENLLETEEHGPPGETLRGQ